VLSGINSAIVRMHDRDALFKEACRVAVEHGEFGIVWIGLLERDSQSLRHVASHGVDKGLIRAVVQSQKTNLFKDHGTASSDRASQQRSFP